MLADTPAIQPPIETEKEISGWFTAKELTRIKGALNDRIIAFRETGPECVEWMTLCNYIQGLLDKLAKKSK